MRRVAPSEDEKNPKYFLNNIVIINLGISNLGSNFNIKYYR